MDDRRKDYRNEATRVGLPHALDGSDLGPLAQDYTQLELPGTGPASPVPADAPEPEDDEPIESGDDLPSWSADVSDHSSWSPPESLLSSNLAAPAPNTIPPLPTPAAASPAPRRSKPKGASKSQPSSPSTPSGMHPSEEFDPEEMSPAKLVEGKTLFHKYILRKRLGSGGMGEVWKVHHIELDCERALKFIRAGLAESPELRLRFRREARAMARVSHDNAVVIHDAFTAGGMAFIEMALVHGQSLMEILKPGQPMPLGWTARILEQLCEVLTVAHAAGIVHRDLKPANLMLLSGKAPGRESLKVLDFGIAKLLDLEENEGSPLTNNGPIGTHAYMSPEQFGTEDVGTRSDIYTVGVILFEFLTGYRPYSAKNQPYQWMQNHVNAPIPRFRDRNPDADVPAEVEDVVRRCLAKSPGDRPQSAEDLFYQFQTASAPYLSPSRSDDLIKPVEHPAPDRSSTRLGISISTERGIEAAEPIDVAANAALSTHHQSEALEPAGLSTLSGGSYEWPAQETSKEAPEASRLPTSPETTRRTTSTTLKPPIDKKRRFGVGAKLAAGVLLVGTLGAGTMFALVAHRGKPHEAIPRVEPSTKSFAKASGGQNVDEIHYERYEHPTDPLVIFLPEGYRPVGVEVAEDRWPRVIERAEDGVKFVRIAGTAENQKYKAYRPTWKAGDPVDGRFRPENDDPIEDEEKEVDVPGFYMQVFEVTNAEIDAYYDKALKKGEPTEGLRYWITDYRDARVKADEDAQKPAVSIGVEMAKAYARSVGGALPRRFEWEYAASSRGTQVDYVWAKLTDAEFREDVAIVKKLIVGRSLKDVTIQGLHDMAANVREWTSDLRGKKPAVCGGCYGRWDPSTDGVARPTLDTYGIKAISEVIDTDIDVGFRVILRCPPSETRGSR